MGFVVKMRSNFDSLLIEKKNALIQLLIKTYLVLNILN